MTIRARDPLPLLTEADASPRPRASATRAPTTLVCDACDEPIVGEPGGHGLYVWTRGDTVRYEEPPLCQSCAPTIGICALAGWDREDEESE